jgi:BirA family biotin operon repressor/biotin-[acetyl-CoA-carboxylase] ligase
MSVSFEVDTSNDLISLFSMKLSLATLKALEKLGFRGIKIKWPNDLVVVQNEAPHKLAGVLAQSLIKGPDAIVVVGLGLNIRIANLRNILEYDRISALSELGNPPNVVDLAELILQELSETALDGDLLVAEYAKYSHTLGTHVCVDISGEKFEGFAKAITQTGSLIVETEDGALRQISVGDIIHLR